MNLHPAAAAGSRVSVMIKVEQSKTAGILTRLRKIEGQVKGLQKMVDENRHCSDITNQIIAVRRALDGAMMQILREHIHNCTFKAAGTARNGESVKELLQIIERVIK